MRWLRDRMAWKKAQRTHQFEHEDKMETTLSCDAVGHYKFSDDYSTLFDRDQRRKFCFATGRKF